MLSTRITGLANRRYGFQRKQGILLAFSLAHRNAEELSALGPLVMTVFGTTEDDYFAVNPRSRHASIAESIRII